MAFKRSFSNLFGRKAKSEESNKLPSALGTDGVVIAIQPLPDGKFLVGGFFKTICGQKRAGIGRLNPDWTLDAEFDPMLDNHKVSTISFQHDGKILIGGGFSKILGQERRNIARLNPDGSLDPSFNFEIIYIVVSAASFGVLFPHQATGNILMTGPKMSIRNKDLGNSILGGNALSDIVILNDRGAVEESYKQRKRGSWNLGPHPESEELGHDLTRNGIKAIIEQTDGKLVICGGIPGYITRFNMDGTGDKSFMSIFDKDVTGLIPQEDGKILAGGFFRGMGRYKRDYLVRLNHDGSLDETLPPWYPTQDRNIRMMKRRSDGTIVVLQADWGRLNYSVSSLDPSTLRTLSSFDFRLGGQIVTLAVQDDGCIVLGGAFNKYNRQECNNIVRLNPDGTLINSS
jgi:uncharacterized delta-60 repeat protein